MGISSTGLVTRVVARGMHTEAYQRFRDQPTLQSTFRIAASLPIVGALIDYGKRVQSKALLSIILEKNPSEYPPYLKKIADDINGKLIGTDGARGEVKTYQQAIHDLGRAGKLDGGLPPSPTELLKVHGILTPEFSEVLGKAHALVLGNNRPYFIGGDTRISKEILTKAFANGLASQGIEVLWTKIPVTTPALGFRSREDVEYTVVVSASHNAPPDNGLKTFKNGEKLPDDLERKIELVALLLGEGLLQIDPVSSPKGVREIHSAGTVYGEYIGYVTRKIEQLMGGRTYFPFEGYKIVMDLAHGAACEVNPKIFEKLGSIVIRMNETPNGELINRRETGSKLPSGALAFDDVEKEENWAPLKERVLTEKADLGIAFDGDADRGFVYVPGQKGSGIVVDGDMMLAFLALHLKDEKGTRLFNHVVPTTMSNVGLIQALQRSKIPFSLAQVGDKYVARRMKEVSANLGGEQSGHAIPSDFQTTGDGAMVAALFLSTLIRLGEPRKAFEKLKEIPMYPQVKKNITASSIEKAEAFMSVLDDRLSRENGEIYRAILEKIQRAYKGYILKVASCAKGDKHVTNRELYVTVLDPKQQVVGWVSIRQSGTEKKKIRVYGNHVDKSRGEQIHKGSDGLEAFVESYLVD